MNIIIKYLIFLSIPKNKIYLKKSMENIKYIDFSDEELSSMLETKEEMEESIKAAMNSKTLPQEIKDYIEKNFKSSPNPNIKDYTKFLLGLLNSRYEDFKVTIKIIIHFTSEENISSLISKKLMKKNFEKKELERLASNVQFQLDYYDNIQKYFNNYIKSMIVFVLSFFNENLLPFILKNVELDINILKNLTLEQYEDKDNKIKLMKFWKKIYYYITKALNITMEKDLIDEEK